MSKCIRDKFVWEQVAGIFWILIFVKCYFPKTAEPVEGSNSSNWAISGDDPVKRKLLNSCWEWTQWGTASAFGHCGRETIPSKDWDTAWCPLSLLHYFFYLAHLLAELWVWSNVPIFQGESLIHKELLTASTSLGTIQRLY